MLYGTSSGDFYPRPPRGGRPDGVAQSDQPFPISIHALREEGDVSEAGTECSRGNFYPRPPRGGRHLISIVALFSCAFLSTPSARRATVTFADPSTAHWYFYPRPPRGGRLGVTSSPHQLVSISIHALREEGDPRCGGLPALCRIISIHALREEGDRHRRRRVAGLGNFYPRPPRGGRQQKQRQNLYFQTNYTTFCTNLEEP